MKIKPLFYLIVFSSFFVSGLLLAIGNNRDKVDPASNSIMTNEISVELPDKQLNILVIGVEEAGAADTILRGVWLILVPSGGETLSFIPLYPQHAVDGNAGYSLPHEAVRLDASSLHSATQLDLLKKQNTWWDEVVLLDEQGLFELYKLIGGAEFIQASLAEFAGAEGENTSWQNPAAALTSQAKLIENMCSQGALFSLLASGGEVRSLTSAHFMYSSSQVSILEFIYGLALANGSFNCQFPTLE